MTTILIIEDDPPTMELERDILLGVGYRVLCALGTAALAIALRERPDLILLDLMLPQLDGWTLREGLLGDPATKDIPVIVLTARAQGDWHAENMRAERVIQKPFKVSELVKAVRAAIGPPAAKEEQTW